MALMLYLIGSILTLVGGIWLIFVAGREKGILWALLTFFFTPIMAIILAFTDWYEVKKPCLVFWSGMALAIIAPIMG